MTDATRRAVLAGMPVAATVALPVPAAAWSTIESAAVDPDRGVRQAAEQLLERAGHWSPDRPSPFLSWANCGDFRSQFAARAFCSSVLLPKFD